MKQTAIEWLLENMPDLSQNIEMGLTLELHAKFQHAKEIEEELLKDAYADGINAHRVNFCNRDEYFQKAFRDKPEVKNKFCSYCGKSSCSGDCFQHEP